jgi:hypothetical protein
MDWHEGTLQNQAQSAGGRNEAGGPVPAETTPASRWPFRAFGPEKSHVSTPTGGERAPEAVCGSFPEFPADFNIGKAFPAKPSKFAKLLQAVRPA